MVDTGWRKQPALISEDVVRQTANRIIEQCQQYGKREVSIIFHGGEPLIGGVLHLRSIFDVLASTFQGSGIHYQVGIQSNGLLFTEEIGDLLINVGASLGISLDGPPEVNDRFRVDHAGHPTSARLEERLRLLLTPPYRRLFAGFLCVIDPTTDPVRVMDYLLSFEPPGLDLLLPHHNHVHPPASRRTALFGDWLVAAFDHWTLSSSATQVRFFESVVAALCGGHSAVESLGTDPVDLIVVETNGDLEAVDSLKSTYDGATSLGINVFDHELDVAARDVRVRARQLQKSGLCQKCRECSLVDVCGGGYLPHRYAGGDNFDQPSIYCPDLTRVITHIRDRVGQELAGAVGSPAATRVP